MFGKSQRAVFKPSVYQPGQRTRRMPRWLVLLLVGIGLGAGGVLFLQTNYGPQRLTVEQSEQLHSELSAANLERQRLQSQLEETTQQRDANKTGHEKLTSDLAEARSKIDALNKELVLFQDAMPADPRGGNLGIRSATFKRAPGLLDFQVLVMREERQGAPFKGTLTFSIDGSYPNGRVATITPEGPTLNVDRYDYALGQLKLPEGFTPKVVVLRVMDGAQKQQAMRIYYVRN
jgi:cell division protein FtsL